MRTASIILGIQWVDKAFPESIEEKLLDDHG